MGVTHRYCHSTNSQSINQNKLLSIIKMQPCFGLARLSKNCVNKTSIILSKRANSSVAETFTRNGFVDQVPVVHSDSLAPVRALLTKLESEHAADSRDNFQANTCSILNWLLLPCRQRCSTQFPPSLARIWFCWLLPSLQSIQALQSSEKGT